VSKCCARVGLDVRYGIKCWARVDLDVRYGIIILSLKNKGAIKFRVVFVVYYESIKRELKIRSIYECRFDERLRHSLSSHGTCSCKSTENERKRKEWKEKVTLGTCVGHLGFVHLLSFNAVNTVQVHSTVAPSVTFSFLHTCQA